MRERLILVFGVLVLFLGFVMATEFESDSNTVALWSFDEGSGNEIFDSTSNNNSGIIFGNATWLNNNLEFDGVDDKVQIVKTPSVDVINNLTIEALVKRNSNEDGMIISKNGPYFLAIRDNVVAGGVLTDSWTETRGISILETGVWYKLMLVYNGISLSVYVDEVLENSVSKTGQMPQVSQQVHIGWGEPGHDQFFSGEINEIRISDIARTPVEEPEPEDDLEKRVKALEARVEELEERTGILERFMKKIKEWLRKLPRGLRKRL